MSLIHCGLAKQKHLQVVWTVQIQCQAVAVKTVPYSETWSGETPVCKLSECSLNGEDVGVSRAKLMASRYSNRLLVVSRVRCVLTTQRLVDDGGQLVVDSLFHWQPVQAPENWCTHQKAHCHILDWLETLEQVVANAVKQCITVVQMTGYERLVYDVGLDNLKLYMHTKTEASRSQLSES